MRSGVSRALAALIMGLPSFAEARTLCTIVVDAADGKSLFEQGDCRTRVTPASTFKIALSLMGFDSGFLKDEHHPELPYEVGYVDWGGVNWMRPTDPTRWMKYSVVWYSQIVARALGAQRLADYAAKFGYGNADFSGDPSRNSGFDRAWIDSSLRISPLEQTIFLRRLVTGELPVSQAALERTSGIVEVVATKDGWRLHGKTGSANPRAPDGSVDEAHGYGWYVGWAILDHRALIFARLNQDDRIEAISGGLRAREELIEEWSALMMRSSIR